MSDETVNVTASGEVGGVDDEEVVYVAEELGKTAQEVAQILVEGQFIRGVVMLSLLALVFFFSSLSGVISYYVMRIEGGKVGDCVVGGLMWTGISAMIFSIISLAVYMPIMRILTPEYMAVREVLNVIA